MKQAATELDKAKQARELAQAQADPESPEFVKRGGDRRSDGFKVGNTNLEEPKNTKPYILRRLAREGRTDLLDRFERGEISANQAAIEAGFRKKRSDMEWALDETGKTPKQWYEGKVAEGEKPLPENGKIGNGRPNSSDNVKPTQGGNSADYTRKRLKRDRPDLLQKVADGGLSLNQAAIEAGFRKKRSDMEWALDETGKTPKQWYEGKVVEKVPKAGKRGGDRKSEEYQSTNGELNRSPNSRERRIAQLKKAGRDDLVAKVEDGSLSYAAFRMAASACLACSNRTRLPPLSG